jgi:hypothetical protein
MARESDQTVELPREGKEYLQKVLKETSFKTGGIEWQADNLHRNLTSLT